MLVDMWLRERDRGDVDGDEHPLYSQLFVDYQEGYYSEME